MAENGQGVPTDEPLQRGIILAASFASALVEPLGSLPFFVHLWGWTAARAKPSP